MTDHDWRNYHRTLFDSAYPDLRSHVCDTGYFDRTLCQEPCGAMHSFCSTCGERQDPCVHDLGEPA